MKFEIQVFVVSLMFVVCASCGNSSSNPGDQNSAFPVISIQDTDILELDSGQQASTVLVSLSSAFSQDISVKYATGDGSAHSGSDFVASNGTLTIPAGATSTTLSVDILGDANVELDEAFSISLNSAINASLANEKATITIRNDDETTVPALQNRPVNLTCDIPNPPQTSTGIQLTRMFSGLSFDTPILMLQAPESDDRWYVVEQGGLIKTFQVGDTSTTVFADLTDRAVYSGGQDERGLLGMAFHPRFQSNQQVFLYYISNINNLQTIVSRYSSPDNGLTITVPAFASEDKILQLAQPAGNHNGGHIAFGEDGYLYIGLGDGGSGNDFFQNALNTQSLLGSMLRIDVDSVVQLGKNYAIPADNPFVGNAQVLDEIYAYGLRNPWRWSFDRQTGEIYLGDVGQSAREEIDSIQSGEHYGWGCFEGTLRNNNYAGNCSGIINNPPIHEYARSDGTSVVGGYVYRGSNIRMSSLVGTYMFADFGFGTIWGLDPSAPDPSATNRVLLNTGKLISAFAEGNNGELYVLSWLDGQIFRIDSAVTNNFPALLSQTGCVDSSNPQIMAEGLIPYRINAPFWSDNAQKDRWLALADGTSITIEANGDWTFPVGSVLMKNFRLGGELIETRLLVHHQDNSWGGYSYEWNESHTDATLVLNGKHKNINGQTYIYPGSAQCSACHTAAAGHVLGLESAQMNRNQIYPSNSGAIGNQIITLDHIGLFSNSVADPSGLPRMVDPHNSIADMDDRVKSYLHSNCAQCHRPGVAIQDVNMDLRFTTEWINRMVCNIAPTRGDLGIAGAQRLAPGNADQSVLFRRMNRRGDDAMPPLGTTVIDTRGSELLRAWIKGLQQCPG